MASKDSKFEENATKLSNQLNSLKLNPACEQGLYVLGGLPKSDGRRLDRLRFNSSDDEGGNGTWLSKCSMNGNRSYFAAVAVNGLIYVIGGRGAPNDGIHDSIDYYNPDTNVWKSLAGVKTKYKRSEFGMAAHEGKIYIVGGHGNANRAVECLDIQNNFISELPELGTGRWGLGVTTFNGKIYACGGQWYKYQTSSFAEQRRTTKYFNDLESYDPITRKWTRETGMLRRRGYFGLAAHDHFLYAAGGMGGECNQRDIRKLDSIERFNTFTGQWTMIDVGLSTPISNLGLAVVNSKLLVVGGIRVTADNEVHDERILNTVQVVDLKRLGSSDQGATATITTLLPSRRHSCAVVALALKISH